MGKGRKGCLYMTVFHQAAWRECVKSSSAGRQLFVLVCSSQGSTDTLFCFYFKNRYRRGITMDSFCDCETARAQPITIDVVPERQKQYQADALRLLAGFATGGSECKRLQIRCGGTPCLRTDIIAVQETEITDYRNAPDFDFIFFTFAFEQRPGLDMIERFQYCRMLLKPGGLLALLLPENKQRPWYSFNPLFMPTISTRSRKSTVVALLQNSGLLNVHQKNITRYGIIVTGNRPVPYTRR